MEQLKCTSLWETPFATIAAPLLQGFSYPWEALSALSSFILSCGEALSKDAYDVRGENVWIAKSARVAPSACIMGPCIICAEAEVRHCAFIRGAVIVGCGAVVGNSTELKNCILFDGAAVPHYNYVGDSILGNRAHMGAGAITSNVKSDGSEVCISCNGERILTGRRKCGAMLGDGAEIGCGAVLNPGTVIGKMATVYPLSSVRGFLPPFHIWKSSSCTVRKI